MSAAPTVVHRLFENATEKPDGPALHEKRAGAWVPTTWGSYARLVKRAAKSLLHLGYQQGDTVAILGFNRIEWVVLDLAAMAAGGAPAGIYTTCSSDEVAYIVKHSEARVVLVENAAQWKKLEPKLGEFPRLVKVVLMRDAEKIEHPMVLRWEAFLALGDGDSNELFDQRMAALEPSGLATLIYTSGTTGPPKAVMLSHDNLLFTAAMARDVLDARGDEVLVSYLPLSHIAEQVLSIHGPIVLGARIYFAESIDKLPENLKEVQPTVFFGVPRIWEKFHSAIAGKMRAATGPKAKIAQLARKVGAEHSALRNAGKPIPPHLRIAYEAMNKLVFSKLKTAIGMGRIHRCISGAAPISREVLEFFASLDITVQEVYGQSEDTGPATFNRYGRVKLGTVGEALPGVDVKIADDGEVLVGGRTVFLGYYKDETATKEALTDDGWLRSGDLGAFDSDGFLSITGRKKEIIITSGGKNITPVNIEQALKSNPLIGEAVVIGDRRKYLTALVAIDPDRAKSLAAERGWSESAPHESAEVRAEVQRTLDEVNSTMARVEQVKKFAVLPRPLGLEHGELTPTLKLKRRVIAKNWEKQIEDLYAGDEA